MAFVKRLRDTSGKFEQQAYSGGAGGVPPVSPLTSVIQTSSQGPRFGQLQNISDLPEQQALPGAGLRGGGGGGRGRSAGLNPLAGSIEALGNKFARAIRGLPTVMSQKKAAEAYGGGEYGPSPISTTPSYSADVTPTPIPSGQFNINPAFTATNLKEGGFIRKKT